MAAPERRWQFGPPLDCFDRGFQYGDGVFETIEYQSGGAWLLDQHRARLWSAADRLGLTWPADPRTDRLLEAVEHRASSLPRAVVKLFLSAAPTRRGYGRAWPHPGLLRASVAALDPAEPAAASVEVIDQPLEGVRALDGLKHLNRLLQVVASSQPPGAGSVAEKLDERLVCNRDGTIEEGTYTNFFYQQDGRLFTPPVHSGVAGVLRAALLDAVELSLSERALPVSDLPQIERCWIGNSVMGLQPVRELHSGTERFTFSVAAADPLRTWQSTSRLQDRRSLLELCSGPGTKAGRPFFGSR